MLYLEVLITLIHYHTLTISNFPYNFHINVNNKGNKNISLYTNSKLCQHLCLYFST